MSAHEAPLREVLRGLPVFSKVANCDLDPDALPLEPLQALEAELRTAGGRRRSRAARHDAEHRR
jgi:hypothetical protein